MPLKWLKTLILSQKSGICPVSLMDRTSASLALDVGSIPARDVLSKAECIRKISNMISAFLFFQVENGMEYQLIRKESY